MIVQGDAVGAARFGAHGDEDMRRGDAAPAVERFDRQRVRVLEDGAAMNQSDVVASERVVNDRDLALDDPRDVPDQLVHRRTHALAMLRVARLQPRPRIHAADGFTKRFRLSSRRRCTCRRPTAATR